MRRTTWRCCATSATRGPARRTRPRQPTAARCVAHSRTAAAHSCACAGWWRCRLVLARVETPSLPSRRVRSNLFAGGLGGLIVAVVVAVLLGSGTIDTGDTTTVLQRQAPLSQSTGASAAAAEQ